VNDIGDRGGFSPSATASSCENGGSDVDVDSPSRDLVGFGGTLKMGLITDFDAIPGLPE